MIYEILMTMIYIGPLEKWINDYHAGKLVHWYQEQLYYSS